MQRLWQKVTQTVGEIITPKPKFWQHVQYSEVAMLLDTFHELRKTGEIDYANIPKRLEGWHNKPLAEKAVFVNDQITTQLVPMFQHIQDIDYGDVPFEPIYAEANAHQLNATEVPAIGPSSHTNQEMSLMLQTELLQSDAAKVGDRLVKNIFSRRLGFSLWIGPTQAPTPQNKAGVYLKGAVPAGTVVALYPGAVYNKDMRRRAQDRGHLLNPDRDTVLIPRYDGAVLDIYGFESKEENPFALAHHVRHPPRGIQPNTVRIDYDFLQNAGRTPLALTFPPELRDYIPNDWGADVSLSQAAYQTLEDHIYAKGVVLITVRDVRNEELFTNHRLAPRKTEYPSWYHRITPEADEELWRNVV